MAQQLGNPDGIFHIRFASWHGLNMLRIDHEEFALTFEQVVDRAPVYSSQDIAKKILEWEYGIEIARTRLLMRTEEQPHASSSDTVLSHKGTCPQDVGVSHG
jgi:hypothetical protein